MNPEKIGLLIAALRKEKHMTQRAVAAALQVSEKTISKWETGRGCPDVSLLPGLAAVLGVRQTGCCPASFLPTRRMEET